MGIPIQFLSRLAVPLIITILHLSRNPPQSPDEIRVYDSILERSDRTLTSLNKEGEAEEPYDYIVIGGGSAGAVVANRLSESGADSVLLLEGGGDPSPVSDVPFAQALLMKNSQMILNYMGVSQNRSCLQNGGVCYYPRGKALGGSSAVNNLFYNRCNPNDYNKWAEFTNDPTWSFVNVLEAFKSIESYHGFYEENPGPNHGSDGEMHVDKFNYLPGVDELFAALGEKGVPIGDLNSGLFPYGFSKMDYNVKDGLRWSTYNAFIQPIESRPNFKIYRYAWATKIHFDINKKAIGVSYTRHGQNRYVSVNKEIILSAGVFDSPKLLMLSGIGPRDHLAQHGIHVVVDLPAVGEYFQDHPGIWVYPFAINKTLGISEYLTPDNINEYIETGNGPLLSFTFPDGTVTRHIANGYITSKSKNPRYSDPTWPDLHVYVLEQLSKGQDSEFEETLFFAIELVRSDQVGSVRLASRNPQDHPLIDGNFLENPEDVERLIDGVEFMVDIFLNSTTFKSLGIKWSDNAKRIEACEGLSTPFPSRAYWRCYIHQTAVPFMHPTSTCRMGPNDTIAVVDSQLRLFGTSGLRVIDSSVMPFVPNGNTNIPSIMVGEMGSRIINQTVNTCKNSSFRELMLIYQQKFTNN